MVSSNTETGISVTYDDSDNTLDFVIGSDVIVNSMIADDAIDSAQIADGSIDTAHIADDQVTGDKLANDITIANNLTVAGNLAVTGTTTQTGSVVSDYNFTGLTDENTGNSTDFGFYGKYVESSTTKYAGLFYDASTDNTFRLFTDTQTVPSTTVNTSATGYAAASLVVNSLTGTIATAAQPNITSLGTLTALTGGTGDFNWDSNTLVVDSSANRVGILNASPDVTLDIGSATDAVHVPVGTTAQRPTGAAGYFRYNSTTSKFEGYTDSWGSIGGGSGTNMDTNIYTGDGSTTAFTLSNAPDDENNLMIFVDGVFQAHNAYSVSGTTLTLSAAPASGRVITAYHSTTTVGGSNNTINTMTGDNSDTTLTLSVAPVHENNVQVYFDGVYQSKSNYSISGTTLTFSTAPPTGVLVEAITNTNTSSTTANQLLDADSDTKIQVEESSDEDKIRFDTGGTERMVLDSTGLTIVDDVSVEGATPTFQLYDTSVTNNVMKFEYDETFLIDIDPNNARGNTALQVDIDNTNAFIIDSSRRVGIGVTSPSSELHVKDASAGSRIIVEASASGQEADIQMKTADDGQGWVLFNNGSANQGAVKYNHASDYMSFRTNGTDDQIKIDSAGHVTMPSQPAFNAYAGTAQANLSNGTVLIFDTERFDIGSNYNTSDGHFTAPVTGKYQLSVNVRLDNIDNASNYIYIQLVTSNSSYYVIYDHGGTDAAYFSYSLSVLADMDASDTAYVSFHQSAGSNTADFVVAGANRFTGVLVC